MDVPFIRPSMLGYRARLFRRIGWSCVELGARTNGDVRLGRGACVASGAELICEVGGSIEIGANTVLLRGALLMTYGGRIKIGRDSAVNPYCVLYGHGDLDIGNNVGIATGCVIVPANHNISRLDVPIAKQGLSLKGVVIEDDVWLGACVTVLDGVRIGAGAVVGAGSVVTKDVPPMAVAVGNPARVIRYREVRG